LVLAWALVDAFMGQNQLTTIPVEFVAVGVWMLSTSGYNYLPLAQSLFLCFKSIIPSNRFGSNGAHHGLPCATITPLPFLSPFVPPRRNAASSTVCLCCRPVPACHLGWSIGEVVCWDNKSFVEQASLQRTSDTNNPAGWAHNTRINPASFATTL